MVASLSIPVNVKGDVLEYNDFYPIKTATGTHDTVIEFMFRRLANSNFFLLELEIQIKQLPFESPTNQINCVPLNLRRWSGVC